MKILADASLPHLSALFPKPFDLLTYHHVDELQVMLPLADVLLCRSTLRVDAPLLAATNIQCVATASSGTDHIDTAYLKAHQIALFDAKGSNAHAVADYVMATLAWLEHHVPLNGKRAGVIGNGAVGSRVIQRLRAIGYEILVHDPYQADLKHSEYDCEFQALTQCDVLCLHPNLHDESPYASRNLINATFLSQLKPHVAMINASRGGIVNECDLLSLNPRLYYCTDVFENEPDINPALLRFATLCTPHIAGHTVEAKLNAVAQLSKQLHTYFNWNTPTLPNSHLESSLPIQWNASWRDRILQAYTPYPETQVLKTSTNVREVFLTLRRAHTTRQDWYG